MPTEEDGKIFKYALEEQSIKKQITIGARFGLIVFIIGAIINMNTNEIFSASGIGKLFGSMFGGSILYMLFYRFWPKKQ